MAAIAAVHGVLAPHRYDQTEITATFADVVSPDGAHRAAVERIHAATGVRQRFLALELDEYRHLSGFGAANDHFIRVGTELAAEAIHGALSKAGLRPRDVDLIFTTTVTGIAAPSLEARLALRTGFRPDVKRIPVFGLGCVAGASGIARLDDYLAGDPDGVAVLVSVELCSLTIQRDDVSMPNIVASGLFGDGAAALVMVGERRAQQMGIRGPSVTASRGRIYPDSERTMGWDVSESGFRIVLSAGVPEVVSTYLGDDVRDFLSDYDLKTSDISAWVCHPGGPKVLEAMQDTLDLHNDELAVTWRSLASTGNLSSSSVLHVLSDTIDGRGGTAIPIPGTAGLLVAMGPGFCAEMVLLSW